MLLLPPMALSSSTARDCIKRENWIKNTTNALDFGLRCVLLGLFGVLHFKNGLNKFSAFSFKHDHGQCNLYVCIFVLFCLTSTWHCRVCHSFRIESCNISILLCSVQLQLLFIHRIRLFVNFVSFSFNSIIFNGRFSVLFRF